MSERANVLVTRPIMEEPTRILRERCDVTVHEKEFGIPRDELLKVVSGRDAIITMLTEKVDGEFLESAGPQLKIVADHAVGFDNRRGRVQGRRRGGHEHARRADRDHRRYRVRIADGGAPCR